MIRALNRKLCPLSALALYAIAARPSVLPAAPKTRVDAIALWAAFAWAELFLQHARWLNYLGPTLAPTLLLAGAAVERFAADARLKILALNGLALISVGIVFPYRAWSFLASPDESAIARGAREILAHAEPGDRLLAIDVAQWWNMATGLQPPTPYFHRLHLLCDFPGAGADRLAQALSARPRFVVIDGDGHSIDPFCERPDIWALAMAKLRVDYAPLVRISGKHGAYVVFELAAPPADRF